MNEHTKMCGTDVHKEFLQVCLLSRSGEYSHHRFRHTSDGILALKDLVLTEGCGLVAFESTGIYWYRLYLLLESDIPVIVVNAYQIKSIPGRKTDLKDSQWIAELALNGLIKPSRIFPRKDVNSGISRQTGRFWCRPGQPSRTGSTRSWIVLGSG
jgi:transposase